MKKVLIATLGIITFVAVLIALGLGYLGYFSPVARILGTDKPKDLGITYTDEDLASVKDKFNLALKESPAGSKTKYEGQQDIDELFTSAELTALVNSSQWTLTPIENVQIKIGDNGFAESSGVLRVDLLAAYLAEVSSGSITETEMAQVRRLLPNKVPYYVSGTIAFEDGSLSFKSGNNKDSYFSLLPRVYAGNVALAPGSAKIGNFAVPSTALSASEARINDFLRTGLAHMTGVSISTLEFNNGQMHYVGKVPKIKYRPVE